MTPNDPGASPTVSTTAAWDPRAWMWRAGRLFKPNSVVEAVVTRAHFDDPPDLVWDDIMFYEEVPATPPLLLRALLPTPIRTQSGEKRVGTRVLCTYSHGTLTKQYTALDRPRSMRFVVLEQRLGVEACVTTVEGSYELEPEVDGSVVATTTRYIGHLRPRALWRPLERALVHRLHRHILHGMGGRRAD